MEINKKTVKESNKERKKRLTKSYDIPIDDFKHRFSAIFNRMESFEELDDTRVYINLNSGRTLLYDSLYHTYFNIKRFDDIYELTEEEYRLGFSELLKKQLRRNMMSQRDLAMELGVSSNMVSRYINCTAMPSSIVFCKMLRVFNCTAEDLTPKDYVILK